jgi:Zn-dependent protease
VQHSSTRTGVPWQARRALARLAAGLAEHPLLSVVLAVLSFSFFGPLAAVVLVATMLDHEFAHRFMMRRLGYRPGPVQLIPFLGAFVRAGKPMLRSADIALIYLVGPVAGILSAAGAALAAHYMLDPALVYQVNLGAAVSVALNLFNLIPLEPLDGGLIARALPYQALLVFPGAVVLWMVHHDLGSTELEVLLVVGVTGLIVRKVARWHRYLGDLRGRAQAGDPAAQHELSAGLDVPLWERLLVVVAYAALIPGALVLLEVIAQDNSWLPS